jgi:hypothetical protein
MAAMRCALLLFFVLFTTSNAQAPAQASIQNSPSDALAASSIIPGKEVHKREIANLVKMTLAATGP